MKTISSPTLPPLQFTAFVVPELHRGWPAGAAADTKPASTRSRTSSFISYASATNTSRASSMTRAGTPHLAAMNEPKSRAAGCATGDAAQAPLLGPAVGAAGSRFVEHLEESIPMATPPKAHIKTRAWAWPTLLSTLAVVCTGLMLALKRFVSFRARTNT